MSRLQGSFQRNATDQIGVLRVLRQRFDRPQKVREVADVLCLDYQHVLMACRRLEAKGLGVVKTGPAEYVYRLPQAV